MHIYNLQAWVRALYWNHWAAGSTPVIEHVVAFFTIAPG
jgi:hypothetical protein